MNKFAFYGRLTKDPTVKDYSAKGADGKMYDSVIAFFTLAVNRRGTDAGADFIQIKAFGRLGEFVDDYLKKGTPVIVEGRVQTGKYESESGDMVYTTDFIASDIHFTAGAPKGDVEDDSAPDFAKKGRSGGTGRRRS